MNTFSINKLSLNYCRDDFNQSFQNERSVEVPIAKWFVDKFNNEAVEIGAVLCHYGYNKHTIIDLTEKHPNVININALDFNYKDKNVVSISTIEHMSQREYGNGSNNDAANLIEKVINESKNYLLEFPVCYNEFLDDFIEKSGYKFHLLRRISWLNHWEYTTDKTILDSYRFGHKDGRKNDGYFNNANAIRFITNLEDFN